MHLALLFKPRKAAECVRCVIYAVEDPRHGSGADRFLYLNGSRPARINSLVILESEAIYEL